MVRWRSSSCSRPRTISRRERSPPDSGTFPTMPSPGESAGSRAGHALERARERERAGCVTEAIDGYEEAIAAAEHGRDATVLAEALRRLAILRRHRDEPALARQLCQRSYDVAQRIGHDVLAAEALNTLGGLDIASGSLEHAVKTFLRALELGGSSRQLRARVQQNLAIVANIQGDLNEALARYERSLAAYRDGGGDHGCSIICHHLAAGNADRGRRSAAECHSRRWAGTRTRCACSPPRTICSGGWTRGSTWCTWTASWRCSRAPTWRWCATGANRSNRATASRSVTASA